MRRVLLGILCAVIAVVAIYQLGFREKKVAPTVQLPVAVATIGSGSEAIAVGADGTILGWQEVPEDAALPTLPLSEPPEGGRLAGPVLQQARVLGAAPPALRPYIASSSYGETGVVIELRSGIELRFGDATRLEEKWRAAAAVLADPMTEALDYVDLQAPRRPAINGSGHALPPLP